MKILESWIRPWKGELIVGQVMALSGDSVICQTASGFEFRVALEDVIGRKVEVLGCAPRAPFRTLCGYRLTEKALLS